MAIESAPSHIAGTCYAVVALSANGGYTYIYMLMIACSCMALVLAP